MAELTPDQTETIRRRTEDLPGFLDNARAQLLELGTLMGLPAPQEPIAEPIASIPIMDQFFAPAEIEDSEMNWLTVCLGYFVGDVLIERLGGLWLVNDNPNSRLVGRYVVGGFETATNPATSVNPFEVAHAYLNTPPARDELAPFLEEIAKSAEGEGEPTASTRPTH